MFHIGQLVVCVDANQAVDPDPNGYVVFDVNLLERGQVYTVRSVEMHQFRHADNVVREAVGIRIEEVVRVNNIRIPGGMEFPWANDIPWGGVRFRPVTKQSIEIVEQLLQPIKETEDA